MEDVGCLWDANCPRVEINWSGIKPVATALFIYVVWYFLFYLLGICTQVKTTYYSRID